MTGRAGALRAILRERDRQGNGARTVERILAGPIFAAGAPQDRVPPGLHGADDARLRRLLFEIGRGEAAALAELYDLTSPKLFGVILRIQRDRSLAEDVLQDAYLRIWQAAGIGRASCRERVSSVV